MTTVRRRPRTTVIILVVLGCWLLGVPGSVIVLAVGLLLLVLLAHRLGRPVYVARRFGRPVYLVARRTWVRPLAIAAVIGLLLFAAAPPAGADPIGPSVPDATDYCRLAPPAETPGAGVAGFLDPQAGLPFDGTAYGDHGYAGFFWWSYDPGCVNSVTQLAGIQSPWDVSGASQSTQLGNWLLGGAVLLDAWATGMRARALDPNTFGSLDTFMGTVATAGYTVLVQPWVWLPLVMLGLTVLTLAIRGNLPEVLRRVTAALAGLTILTIAAAAPMDLIRSADQALVDAQQRIDTQVMSRLPADVLPQIQHCDFDQTALYKPHFDDDGLLKVAGTACTVKYTPDPKDPVNAEYLRRWLYPEVLVRNTIQRYWQQGMIGSQNLTDPDADLGARFLNGQAVNLKLPDLNEIQQNAPAGAVWCTYQDNKQVCGRSDKPGPPGNVVAATEAEYRSAIEDAGPTIYPYIQGRAGNRTAAGFSALAASTAAAPFPAAAYTAVLTARLLLRLALIAGLFVGIGMMVRPHLARRVLGVAVSSLLVVLLFSAAGALMTYLSMVMLSPTMVAGQQVDPNSGVIILALISLVVWLLTRPIKRITGMLSYAATGNPHQLSEQRRRAMAGLYRLSPLPRWRRGTSHRVSDPPEYPAGTVTPTEPARSSRPEQVTIVRRRTTQLPVTGQPVGSAPAPGPGEPATTRIPRTTSAAARGSTLPADRRPAADAEPTQVTPVVAGMEGQRDPGPAPAIDSRPAKGHLLRQFWNGRRWVRADDDRVFRPADPDHRPVGPAPDEPAVFRPPDPPPWVGHSRPEARTTSWRHTADDPRRI
ncbi:hypothetical protein [Nakamurella sp.]|uniref:hypothetical protein n=1 Tax=Nakamurella sp. TaxID=1869182 RepID=UPI003B3B10CC